MLKNLVMDENAPKFDLNYLNEITMRYCNDNYIPKNPNEIELLVTLTQIEHHEFMKFYANSHPINFNSSDLEVLPKDIVRKVRLQWGPLCYLKLITEGEISEVREYSHYLETPVYVFDLETGARIATSEKMKYLLMQNWLGIRQQLLNPPKGVFIKE